ncbi:MAG: DsrE family protein [Armatimonadetes bacterium]|nr:DsrE family protein [Armatimonadota bacterium]
MGKKTFWLGLTIFAIFASLMWLNAQSAKRDGTLFLNLTSDEPWRAEMAINYATQARKLGYDVVVFLNVRGVFLARKEPLTDLVKAQEQLKTLMALGSKVYVCPSCSKRAGIKPRADWIDGAIEGSHETIELQMAPNTKVMSW